MVFRAGTDRPQVGLRFGVLLPTAPRPSAPELDYGDSKWSFSAVLATTGHERDGQPTAMTSTNESHDSEGRLQRVGDPTEDWQQPWLGVCDPPGLRRAKPKTPTAAR